MSRSLYLVNPRTDFPGYFGAEVLAQWGYRDTASIADLALPTVAAMVPGDWEVELCDECTAPVDLDHPAEFVGLTGKVTQGTRMLELAREFKKRGKTVIVGGPYASLSPEVFRGRCDVLVTGEIEEIAAGLFADLESGSARAEYTGDKPDLAGSPVPRWDLYPHANALEGQVQTSRGCPFECEFCDVIQYLGRKQRHKPVANVLAELDVLYANGFRSIFLADDNFTAYRARAKELLQALYEWNAKRPDGAVSFSTQVSIDAARDPELIELAARAGMTSVFIGIETPNVDSLKESLKRQNLGCDLLEQIGVFLEHGITVDAGMIVGFDSDGLDIFERQYEFAMASPVPIFSLGALVAPAATPLHERMSKAGRLVEGAAEVAAMPWDTNLVPIGMTRDQLFEGLRWLCNKIYDPERFTTRMLRMIEGLGARRGALVEAAPQKSGRREVEQRALSLARKFIRQGPAERNLWNRVWEALEAKPEAGGQAFKYIFRYAQVRCLYEAGGFWEPQIAEMPVEAVESALAASASG